MMRAPPQIFHRGAVCERRPRRRLKRVTARIARRQSRRFARARAVSGARARTVLGASTRSFARVRGSARGARSFGGARPARRKSIATAGREQRPRARTTRPDRTRQAVRTRARMAQAARASSSSDASASSPGGLVLPALDTRGKVAAAVAALCGVGAAAFVAYRVARRRRATTRPGRRARGPADASRRWETKVVRIRHGQSTFNAAYARDGVDPMLFDAPLSALGRRAARRSATPPLPPPRERGGGDDALRGGRRPRRARGFGLGATRRRRVRRRSATTFAPMPEVVLCSPLTRALQTAVARARSTPARVEVLPELREHLTKSATRSPRRDAAAARRAPTSSALARRVAADPDPSARLLADASASTRGPTSRPRRVPLGSRRRSIRACGARGPRGGPPAGHGGGVPPRPSRRTGFIEPECGAAPMPRRGGVRTRQDARGAVRALVGHADFFVRLAARDGGSAPRRGARGTVAGKRRGGRLEREIRVPRAVAKDEGRRARRRRRKTRRKNGGGDAEARGRGRPRRASAPANAGGRERERRRGGRRGGLGPAYDEDGARVVARRRGETRRARRRGTRRRSGW